MQRIPGYRDLPLEGRVCCAALPESGRAFVQATQQNHARKHRNQIVFARHTGPTAKKDMCIDTRIMMHCIGRFGRWLNLRPATVVRRRDRKGTEPEIATASGSRVNLSSCPAHHQGEGKPIWLHRARQRNVAR